jgi:hypothetical protein
MTPSGVVLAALDLTLARVWPGLARGIWCRRQRRRLGVPGHGVLWVRPDSVAWAEWGARRGFFDLERMSGLPYLSAVLAAR